MEHGADGGPDVRRRLDGLEVAMDRLRALTSPGGPDEMARALSELGEQVRAVRAAVDRCHESEQAARHRLGHDLRSSLNAIAGWNHILRLDGATSPTARRASDVFDRNVRAMTRTIEAYTEAPDA